MIIIKETLIAKPGNAGKLAKMMKQAAGSRRSGKTRIMTDLAGDFNQVVMETEMESLKDLEQDMKEYEENPAIREQMKGYQEMYLTGKREIFRVW